MGDRRIRLLLVDDNDAFRELLGSWLQPRYEVAVARNAREGLDILSTFAPDLVVLDVMMPEVSGIEMYRVIRSRPGLAELPVLFLTAYHQVLDGQDADVLRNCRVLLKPFRLEELTEQIAQMLGAPGKR